MTQSVIKTFDFSTSEATARELKYAARGLGVILEEGLDAKDRVEERTELVASPTVGPSGREPDDVLDGDLEDGTRIAPDEPDGEDFAAKPSKATGFTVTYLGGVDELDNAVGVYEYDVRTGRIGEGRILFASTDRTETGAHETVEVGAGKALGLFIVSGAGASGVDLADCADGGLFFRNFATGGAAGIGDGIAPLPTDAAGGLLPLTILHATDDNEDDGVNLLNAGAAPQATELDLYPEDDPLRALRRRAARLRGAHGGRPRWRRRLQRRRARSLGRPADGPVPHQDRGQARLRDLRARHAGSRHPDRPGL